MFTVSNTDEGLVPAYKTRINPTTTFSAPRYDWIVRFMSLDKLVR